MEEAAEDHADAWFAASDPSEGVGSKHHTVPAFYLRRFAKGDQLAVRRLDDGVRRLTNVADLAQRDFYTVVTDHPADGSPRLDGRLEQLLRTVEGRGATAIRRLANPLFEPQALPPDLYMDLLLFLAFQFVRGVRTRREQELIADLSIKMDMQVTRTGETPPLPADLAAITIVGHPNEYLRMLGDMAGVAMESLVGRPLTQVQLDVPALFTTDEPVVLHGTTDTGHTPDCFLSEKQRRRRAQRAFRAGATSAGDLVHVRTTRPRGIGSAEEVLFPMDPSRALVFGPRGEMRPARLRLTGEDAARFASELANELLSQAYLWVAGHPDNNDLSGLELPEPGPLVEVCDGGSPFAQALRTPPTPRHPTRLRRDWPG